MTSQNYSSNNIDPQTPQQAACWLEDSVKVIDSVAVEAAKKRQDTLTKPQGSLGELEQLGVLFSGWQGTETPQLEKIQIAVFAGDHGIANEGVSAFPQQVTLEMIRNFCRGGAAISVLAKSLDADFHVINMGTATPCEELPQLRNVQLAPGTRNFLTEPAMDRELCESALLQGKRQVSEGIDLFIGGEMGIGNTSSASALVCALLNQPAEGFVGSGTGLNEEAVSAKSALIQRALDAHMHLIKSPLDCLQYFGGLEIAALTGAYIRCAQLGIPVLVDGFISSAAALMAVSLNAETRHWMVFGHASAERGHRKLLAALNAKPLISLNMRLGEGSGAAVAVPLLKSACLLQSEMATFDQAGVSQ